MKMTDKVAKVSFYMKMTDKVAKVSFLYENDR